MNVQNDSCAVVIVVYFAYGNVFIGVYVSFFSKEPFEGVFVPGLVDADNEDFFIGKGVCYGFQEFDALVVAVEEADEKDVDVSWGVGWVIVVFVAGLWEEMGGFSLAEIGVDIGFFIREKGVDMVDMVF